MKKSAEKLNEGDLKDRIVFLTNEVETGGKDKEKARE